ncbi:hypothetical protein BV22DRAFT_1052653 [Leucogyrophana mollusca]|uniref:Uncharacterized protein n=1 Tax=Leucogyrophana mollusca TaxID=85980 RepID=A0ACB8AVS7_9AGAM|nr:hypothetical protein BV22DRAFT_1052653 [Leucogyrophana mollusca]
MSLPAHEPTKVKDCSSWREQVPSKVTLDLLSPCEASQPSAVEDACINPQDSTPPTPEEDIDEDSLLTTIALPPFLETRRHADLMVAFVNCQRLERRAEGRLIARRLKRMKIERELFYDLGHRLAKRRRVADANVAVSRVMLRYSGIFPEDAHFGTDMANDADSEATSEGSDCEAFRE